MPIAAVPVRRLAAGNWKMHGLRADLAEARRVRERLTDPNFAPGVDVMICPPATLIGALAHEAGGTRLLVGGQDCHTAASGAHTGDISAEMLKDAGASAVIVGHSERRAEHGERDAMVKAKANAAHRAGLLAIVCIGETAAERAAGETLPVVARQLAGSLPDRSTPGNTVIAYEPIWAIGTGITASPDAVAQVHAHLRRLLASHLGQDAKRVRILYGGSVKPDNARELMAVANVDGALVGGASLKSEDFLAIITAMLPRDT
jgi:triosephosphate isomerase (TIM)